MTRSNDYDYDEEELNEKFNDRIANKEMDEFDEDEFSDDDFIPAKKRAKTSSKSWNFRPVILGVLMGVVLGGIFLFFNNKVEEEGEIATTTTPVNLAQKTENWENKNITPNKSDSVVFHFDKPDPKDMVEEDLTPEPEGRSMPLANQVQEHKPTEHPSEKEKASSQGETSPAKESIKTQIKKPVIKVAENDAVKTKPKQNKSLSAEEKALMMASSKHYTLQLLGVSKEESVQQFIKAHALEGKSHYFKTKRGKSDWYVLVYGDYASKDQAKAALAKLPLKNEKLSPWVREMKSVQEDIRKQG